MRNIDLFKNAESEELAEWIINYSTAVGYKSIELFLNKLGMSLNDMGSDMEENIKQIFSEEGRKKMKLDESYRKRIEQIKESLESETNANSLLSTIDMEAELFELKRR